MKQQQFKLSHLISNSPLNKKELVNIFALLLLFGLVSGCANLKTKGASDQHTNQFKTEHKTHELADISHLTLAERTELYEMIIAADLASFNENHELATSYYLASAKLSNSMDLIKLSINSAKRAGDILAIMQAADLWLELSPDNMNAFNLKIGSLLLHQDLVSALSETEKLFKIQKSEHNRLLLLNEISQSQSPRVVNVYFARLSQAYPESPSVQTAWANYMTHFASRSKTPKNIYGQAFAVVESALKVKSDFLPAIDLKTKLYYQTGQDEKAEAYLRGLHLERPDSKEISLLLGQLLYDLKKHQLAEQQYLTLLKQFPDNLEARFYLGAIYFSTNRPKESLQQYRKLLGTDYKPQSTYFFCGSSAVIAKDFAQAIACYDLVESGPYLTSAKIELAKLHVINKDFDKALNLVRNSEYKVNKKSNIRFLNIEIEILKQHIDENKARDLLDSALEIYPAEFSFLIKKIKFDSMEEDPVALNKLFTDTLTQSKDRLTENDLQQYNLTVAAFFQSNHFYQNAVDWLTNALKKDPDNTDYLYSRALYKEPLGLLDEMVTDFKKLLKIQPENNNIKNALGYTLVDINQELDYASGLIEAAFLAMPNNAAVIDSKGWLAYRKGYLDQAIKYLSASFKLSPSAEVATHLAEVYWVKKDKKQAEFYFKKAESLQPDNYLLKMTKERLGILEDETEKKE
ncbi:MAG: tetratricopeptide repeat protein [Kangiellaceae bacterium]